jgi:DNA-binding transcriptional LysR family regulator
MDRLAAMEAFVRVVDAGSFSGAAKQLRIGQPAVSKTIAQLEDRLGVRLLLRSTHGLTSTEAGRDFYERAKRAIKGAEEAELAARGVDAALSGRLRICVPVTFARLIVVPRLSAFLAEYPAIDLDLVLEDRNIDLIEAGIDLAVRLGCLADSSLTARKIADGQGLVVGTPSYFDRRGVPQAPSDLLAHEAVIYDQPCGGIAWTFRKETAETFRNGGRPSSLQRGRRRARSRARRFGHLDRRLRVAVCARAGFRRRQAHSDGLELAVRSAMGSGSGGPPGER